MFLIADLIEKIRTLSSERLTSECKNGAETLSVTRFAPLESAGAEHVAFLAQSKYRDAAKVSKAGVLVISPADFEAMYAEGCARALIVTANPYAWFAYALQVMLKAPTPAGCIAQGSHVHAAAKVADSAVIDAGATVEAGAVVGERTHIHAGAYIGAGTTVGDDAIVYANATVYHGCKIGNRVILHSGCVIGADGFGFAPFAGEWVKIPQIGGVRIEDDVEIGANTTIDRGALEDTVVGKGSKLDNQIQLGHNCRVGEHSVMAACTGVAGSTKIGSHCIIGGAANINGHITIPDGVMVGPATNLMHWEGNARQMMGFWPAQDKRDFERTAVLLMNLTKMRQQIKELERQVAALKPKEEKSE
ncbi:MAG: UDP-3-O-(3-hydroxymyristoyl)glucosamine N-acyltransferase [Sutterellaceae bacterium]|nr:UDP-3-O-(3-hydroxymyristoyl)glucosamine N-acyltransferase [Sutterellaceae bacterium]